jgi:hypothetical protein
VETEGKTVPVLVKSPLNDDHLTRSVVILPLDRFTPRREYKVNLTATKTDGTEITRRWTFRTESR